MSFNLPASADTIRRFVRLPTRPQSMRLEASKPLQDPLPAIEVQEIGPLGLVLRAIGRNRNPVKRALGYLRTRGLKATVRKLRRALNPETEASYAEWVARYDTLTEADMAAIRRSIAAMSTRPLISILMPVYATDLSILRQTIASIEAQLYPNWQLCIVDDASPDPALRQLIAALAAREPRIRTGFRAANGGVVATSNDALALAEGEFVALVDHDDLLPPHALYLVAAEIAAHPEAMLIYSDEDKIDGEGLRREPHFKPDWNPALLQAQNYINHLAVLRTDLVRRLGGFRAGFDGSQDYDLMLRATEQGRPDQIRHIPHILYHWRIALDASTLSMAKPDATRIAAVQAVAEHLERTGVDAAVERMANGPYHRIVFPQPQPMPRVSLIVPTRDRVQLLRQCLTGLIERTDYPDLEIIIVDNESVGPATLAYLAEIERDARVRVLRQPGPFNFSRLNNQAVAEATGSILGFVNNDIDVIARDWLKEMVAQVVQPGIGAVGAKLYYGDDTIQHAGVILGIGGVGSHAHKGLHRSDPGYFSRAWLVHDVGAVTAACMLVPRRVFDEVDGFDEEEFAIAFNDVDLCLKIRSAGYRIVFTPFAELYHLESASRGDDFTVSRAARFEREKAAIRRRWAERLDNDPYYNPNLTLESEQFGLAWPPRAAMPWRHGN